MSELWAGLFRDNDDRDRKLRERAAEAAGFAVELRAMSNDYGAARSDDWRGLRDRLIAQQSIDVLATRYQVFADVYQDEVRPGFKPAMLA